MANGSAERRNNSCAPPLLTGLYLRETTNNSVPFHWNEAVYNTIDEWLADTGLDANSQFFYGPLPSRAQRIRAEMEALKSEPTLRPNMFHKLYNLATEPD